MNRLTTRTGGDRTAMGVSRAVVDTINDSPFMQMMGAKIMGEEQSSDIETMHPFGMTSVPMGKTTDEQAKAGMLKGAAEVLITGLMGNRSHPIASPPTDRRFRLNGLGAGETGFHDAHQQFLHMGKDAARLISPKRVSLEVSKEKPQAAQSSGSDAKAPKRNNGADVGAERERMGGIVFNEDGSWTIEAKGPGKIKIGDVTWEFTSEGLKQTGGKHTHDGRNVGKDHKHGGVQLGAAQTGEPAA